MLFLGWNVGLASDVFLLESGCVGFLASSFMCHSFYILLTLLTSCILIVRKIQFII